MASNIAAGIQELLDRIYEEASQHLTSAGKAIADDLTTSAEQAIDNFYLSYTPIEYVRGQGMKNTYERLYKNNGKKVYCGVRLTSPSTSYPNYNNKRSVSGAYIFELTYAGRHGATELFPFPVTHFPPIMTPSPLDRIYKKRDQIIANIDAYF